MFFLLITIVLNVLLSAIFKILPKFGIHTLQAIVVNYYVCVVTGSIYLGKIPYSATYFSAGWFPWSLLMGCGFIVVFNLIAWCTRVDGITIAAIANKLSLVIPAVAAILFFGDTTNPWKIGGILIAFPAIYLVTRNKNQSGKLNSLALPAALFIGGGLLDTCMNYVQHHFLTQPDDPDHYTIYCFTIAGTIGTILLSVFAAQSRMRIELKNVIAGLCIGVPNYFSIYFFVRMLHSPFMQASASIPLLNIGIVVASAVIAMLFYGEKITWTRAAGVALSLIAIVMIAFGR